MRPIEDLIPYLSHQAWRCQYRRRYKRCLCGLDDLCDRLGIARIPADDPERERPPQRGGRPGSAGDTGEGVKPGNE